MPDRVRIIGSYLSPYVRKVLVCLHLKGVPWKSESAYSRVPPRKRLAIEK